MNKEESMESELPVQPLKPNGIGIRHLQAVLIFFGLTIALALRTNISVGIIAMTDNSSNPKFEAYNFSDHEPYILSSFFWGYIVMQIPAGMLADYFGAKILFLIALTGTSIFSIIIPFLAPLGWEYVCGARVAGGLFQGLVYPSIYALMAKWIHPSERALSVLIVTGNQFGIFFMLIISGSIVISDLGWPGIFYISGGLGLIWAILWFIFGSDSPAKYKNISMEEKQFIEGNDSTKVSSREILPVPWIQIFTSVPFIALIVVHCAQNWGYYTLLTELPLYMKGVLNFDIQSSSILLAMPYLVMTIICLMISPLSDFFINRNYLSRELSRKMFNSFGHWIPMICLIGLGFVNNDSETFAAIALMILGVGFNAGTNAGFLLNHMDLAPNFSGTLYAITNLISNIPSILAPMFVGRIVTDSTNASLWQIVFFVAAGFYFIGNLVFVVFGKTSIQSWNNRSVSSR